MPERTVRRDRGAVVAAVRWRARRLATALGRLGPAQSEHSLVEQARRYWGEDGGEGWRNNAHWRDGPVFETVSWTDVGAEHLELFRRMARMAGAPDHFARIVDWGCGGGANAIHFAPHADELVAVDVSAASVEECARQVAASCDTPVVQVVASLPDPEDAAGAIPTCDLFLCLYVLELVPSPAYGLRLVEIARDLLRDGGLAFVQVKYTSHERLSRPRRRSYRANLANMTTYSIDGFWRACAERGLDPIAVHLVPRNALDERYAYFLLRRPMEVGGDTSTSG